VRQMGPGMVAQQQVTCRYVTLHFINSFLSSCSGKGETIRAGDACKKCHGNKTIKTPERLKIVVPAGSRDGVSMQFRGQAHQEPGLTTGDIIITLTAKTHPVFQVRQKPQTAWQEHIYSPHIRYMMQTL
jgi:DnaJ family protein A protein 2